MVYTHKNTATKAEISLTLTPFSLNVEGGNASFSMPFASISRVKLSKSGAVYYCTLTSEQHQAVIPSVSYHQGVPINQARAYTTFLRVLHYHLREKSKAEFVAGMSTWQAMAVVLVFLTSAFGIFFLVRMLSFTIEPVLAGMLGSFCITGSYLWLNKYQFPKPYPPGEIPASMLPEECAAIKEEEFV